MSAEEIKERIDAALSDVGLTERHVSEKLAVSVHLLRKQRWNNTGIPYIKVGGSIRYMASDVDNYIDQQRVHPRIKEKGGDSAIK